MFDAFTGLMRMAWLPGRDNVHRVQTQRTGLVDPTAPIRVPLRWAPAPETSPTPANGKPPNAP
jgi:hypothetical protein